MVMRPANIKTHGAGYKWNVCILLSFALWCQDLRNALVAAATDVQPRYLQNHVAFDVRLTNINARGICTSFPTMQSRVNDFVLWCYKKIGYYAFLSDSSDCTEKPTYKLCAGNLTDGFVLSFSMMFACHWHCEITYFCVCFARSKVLTRLFTIASWTIINGRKILITCTWLSSRQSTEMNMQFHWLILAWLWVR